MKSPNVAPNFATRCRCLFASRESALVQVIGAGDVLPLGQVAQLVEQRTENPRVGSSILPLAIPNRARFRRGSFFVPLRAFPHHTRPPACAKPLMFHDVASTPRARRCKKRRRASNTAFPALFPPAQPLLPLAPSNEGCRFPTSI